METVDTAAATQPESPVNLGLRDGEVTHAQVNQALARADRAILFGEQTRLPHFPEDVRLPKLHAGNPLVLIFWKVMRRIPPVLRAALVESSLSVTLVRGGDLLFFRDYRCHQSLHIGCRRRTIYLPQVLLHAAEERGYDYWALAEGVIHASWILLDYLLLTAVIADFARDRGGLPGPRLTPAALERLTRAHDLHRRDAVEENRSELLEFTTHYHPRIAACRPAELSARPPWAVARRIFDAETEERWACNKTERVADVFKFPRRYLFDRDIIHGVARDLALRRGLAVAPGSFADILHDYRDAQRFDPDPPLTEMGRHAVPKPRACFLHQVVALGTEGLRGYFSAYRAGEPEVRNLMHPLWMHLCSLSSDPAGVYTRVGRCRAIGREGLAAALDAPVAGIMIRLDRAPNYAELLDEVARMGEGARAELDDLVARQRLLPGDEWETFKARKQVLVQEAVRLLDRLRGDGTGVDAVAGSLDVHSDELIIGILRDNPYRVSSDPSGVLTYLRLYRRSLTAYGPGDPDTDYLLAAVLLRLDRHGEYQRLLQCVEGLGTPAMSALHGIFEQIPERDQRRRLILREARVLWSRMLAAAGKQRIRALRGREE